MKLKQVITLLLISVVQLGYAQSNDAIDDANEETRNWRYEIECEGVGQQGIFIIKVYSYSRRKDVAIEQAKKNAIHGVIFKGIPSGKQGCVSQPALARSSNLEQQKRDYFNSFFHEGGKYMKFVNLTTDGAVKASDRYVVGGRGLFRRKQYKIGVIVSVNVARLRQELEDAGVIKKLSSGF